VQDSLLQRTKLAHFGSSVKKALGVETTALAALIAAGGLILTFHPFRIGDLVEIDGSIGIVEEIQLVNTVLKMGDSSKVILPNGQVAAGKITNYSTTGIRRVDAALRQGGGLLGALLRPGGAGGAALRRGRDLHSLPAAGRARAPGQR
jgi:hypothetical protein